MKIIPVLFTSANHLTEAHVYILLQARKRVIEMFNGKCTVPECIISPVNDNYINYCKFYPMIKIDGGDYRRLRFTGEERIKIAEATVKDFQKRIQNNVTITISNFEVKHPVLPGSHKDPLFSYIEHYEVLKYLQTQEIEQAAKKNEVPALYVLVCGSDLALGMQAWQYVEKDIPFLAAMRNSSEIIMKTLNHPLNYLKKINQYNNEHDNFFKDFVSEFFVCSPDDRCSLSSTKLANCDIEALKLIGPLALESLLSILQVKAKEQNTEQNDEYKTAQATITYFSKIKKYLNQQQQDIINKILDVDATQQQEALSNTKSVITLENNTEFLLNNISIFGSTPAASSTEINKNFTSFIQSSNS